jgi:hypothetical protein
MKIENFDIDRIIGITIYDERRTSHKWLPRKEKKWFFGLFSRGWHSEGFYSNGCYRECYESGCWDATPSNQEWLIQNGYLVKSDNTVWSRPYVTVYMESKYEVSKSFDTLEQAIEWTEDLKMTTNKTFEIVKHTKS